MSVLKFRVKEKKKTIKKFNYKYCVCDNYLLFSKMILFKKSYAEQLLHLALALSLLRVNPDSYLGYGWQSQLATNHGDGIQLEHAVIPAVQDYPYSNRKAIIPIIEDLVHFNRYRQTNSYDIQTYLLNIQNEQNSAETAAQEHPLANNETITNLENRTTESLLSVVTTATFNELDLFLNSAHFTDSDTLHDLNLADLRDYDDRPLAATPHTYPNGIKEELPLDIYTNPIWIKEETASTSNAEHQRNEYAGAGLPIKSELPDVYAELARELFIKNETASTSYTSDLGASVNSSSSQSSNYTKVIDWSEFYDITPVTLKKEDDDSSSNSEIKQEDDEKNSTTSGFSSSVELTQEVCS